MGGLLQHCRKTATRLANETEKREAEINDVKNDGTRSHSWITNASKSLIKSRRQAKKWAVWVEALQEAAGRSKSQ